MPRNCTTKLLSLVNKYNFVATLLFLHSLLIALINLPVTFESIVRAFTHKRESLYILNPRAGQFSIIDNTIPRDSSSMKITYKVIGLSFSKIKILSLVIIEEKNFLSDRPCVGFGQYREAKIDIEKGEKKRGCSGAIWLRLFWGGANLLHRVMVAHRVWIRSLEPFRDTGHTFDASSGPSHTRRRYPGKDQRSKRVLFLIPLGRIQALKDPVDGTPSVAYPPDVLRAIQQAKEANRNVNWAQQKVAEAKQTTIIQQKLALAKEAAAREAAARYSILNF